MFGVDDLAGNGVEMGWSYTAVRGKWKQVSG